MKSTRYPQSRTDGILTQKLADEILVYDLDREKVLCLSESTALVWHQCDGTRSVAEITRALAAETGKSVSEDMVWMALRELKSENLLALGESFETPFDGMTRRDMVRRVGLAALGAPLIFQVAAPSAAHAQSENCGPVGNCTVNSTTLCICLPIALPGSNINPNGCPCETDGDCAGDCVNGVCAGGTNNPPICIPGDTSNRNPDCCPCSNVEGCANCCNDGTCGPCVG